MMKSTYLDSSHVQQTAMTFSKLIVNGSEN